MDTELGLLFNKEPGQDVPSKSAAFQTRGAAPTDAPELSNDSDTTMEDEELHDDVPQVNERVVEKVGKQMADIQLKSHEDALEDMGNFFEHSALDTLTQERDTWKLKAEQQAKEIETLKKRSNAKLRKNPALSSDLVTRLNFLEKENQRLKSENSEMKSKLRETEGENSQLSHETKNKSEKLRGANKKVQKEKSLAKQEKEKAETASQVKNERLKAERAWRKERNDALAASQEQRKINEELKAELYIEKAGRPHMREDGTDKDDTAVVIPIEFKIYRGDFMKLQMVFEANQMKITEQFKRWYGQWKKPKEEKVKVVGANYGSNKDMRKKIKIGVDLYEDMTESQDEVDGNVYVPQTGAEHDGW